MLQPPRAATIQAETDGQLWAMDRQTFRRILLKSAFRKRKMYEALLDAVPMLKTLQVGILPPMWSSSPALGVWTPGQNMLWCILFFLIYRVTNVWTWPMLLYPRHLPRENESSSKVSNTYKSTKTMIFIHILSVYDKFRWIPLAISLWIPSAILLEITQTIQKLPRIITKGTSNGIWERIADFQKNCGRNLKKINF